MFNKNYFAWVCLLAVILAFHGMPCVAEAAKLQDPAGSKIAARIFSTPVMVIGTYNAQGQTNFSVVDRGGVASSKPQTHFALCMQRTSYTYKNIILQKALTINIPSEKYATETDLFGCFSGLIKDESSNDVYQNKVGVTGLTVKKGGVLNAPMLVEYPLTLECELVSTEVLDEGSPFDLLIVKVVNVWADKNYLNDAENINPKPDNQSPILFYFPGAGEHYGYYTLGDFLGTSRAFGASYKERIISEDLNASPKNEASSGSGGCNAGAGGGGILLGIAGIWITRKGLR